MKLRHTPRSPFVRKVLVLAYEHGLVDRIGIFGYLDLRFPEDGWRRRHPKLATWYEVFEQLPAMQATRPPAG